MLEEETVKYMRRYEGFILFYQTRSDFDYVPPIKVDANMLSDFGEAIFKQVET